MQARERIQSLIQHHHVVLFMKGTRHAPQCGFSARVVDVLDELLPEYEAVDVLADPELREEIKRFSDWPTLPQLYVGGKLVGGADIVSEMARTGELAAALGASPRPVEAPEITLTEAAAAAFRRYAGGERPEVRMTIDRGFAVDLDLTPAREGDLVLDLGGITFAIDRASARRADGLTIDHVSGPSGTGFRIDNPNAPPQVRSLAPEELDRMRRGGKPHLLIDVRTPEENELASIEGGQLLDMTMRETLEDLDRSTALVLYCHHGIRSRAAAEHCLRMGFREVWNLEGGIDAWSLRVDPKVPRY